VFIFHIVRTVDVSVIVVLNRLQYRRVSSDSVPYYTLTFQTIITAQCSGVAYWSGTGKGHFQTPPASLHMKTRSNLRLWHITRFSDNRL